MNHHRAKTVLWVYAILILLLVLLADTGVPAKFWVFIGNHRFADKAGHFVLFGIFSYLLNTVLRCREFRIGRVRLMRGSLMLMAAVTLEEVSQLLFVRRHFDWYDLLADALGIWCFGWLARWLARRSESERETF